MHTGKLGGTKKPPMYSLLCVLAGVCAAAPSNFSCQHIKHPGSPFTLRSLPNSFTDAKSPATTSTSEHPASLHLFQLHCIFFTDKHVDHGGVRLSIRDIMSLRHLKAFGHPDTRNSEGPEEQGGITLQFLESGDSQTCGAFECL